MPDQTERKGNAAVSWLTSPKHPYEDRYRLLTREVPLVRRVARGEVVAVFDGIGSAPKGMSAAQEMADGLLAFYRESEKLSATSEALHLILQKSNQTICDWGCVYGTTRPLGGCAGTVAWLIDGRLTIFHAGDTVGMLLRAGKNPLALTRLHEQDGAIFRYFGLGSALEIDIASVDVEDGDLVLLMSDGVTKMFSTTEAAALVNEVFAQTGDVARAAEALASQSRRHGSTDDITVLVMEVVEE